MQSSKRDRMRTTDPDESFPLRPALSKGTQKGEKEEQKILQYVG